jgi:hypothetical protein
MFYASHDPFRRVFIEVRGAATWALVVAAVATLITQSALSIVIARRLARARRIPIANGLRAVLAWGLSGLGIVGWSGCSRDGGTPWLSDSSASLSSLAPARLLFVTVRRAVAPDG